MITIEIKTGNSAFDEDSGAEVARILRDLADTFEAGNFKNILMDINGNKVGTVRID